MSQNTYRVLIADDEAAIRNGLAEIIPWSQYDACVVATAQDGTDALKKIQSLQPDLVVIDIKMPGLDGLEVIHQTKQAGLFCRFLILSGYNDFSLAQKAVKYGANAYFLKPLKIDEFKNELSVQFQELSMQKEQEFDRENYDSLRDISRVFFLNQLLRGEIRTHQELERRLSVLPLSLQSDSCRVILCSCCISDYDVEELTQALQFAFASFSCEVWTYNEQNTAIVAIIVNTTAIPNTESVSNTESVPNTKSVPCDRLRSILTHTLKRLHAKNKLRYYAGIGKEVLNLEKIFDSFRSASASMAYHIYETGDDIYDETAICTKRPSAPPDSTLISSILQAVESGDKEKLPTLSECYIRSLFYVLMPSPDYIHGMCIFLLTRIRMLVLSKNPTLTDPLEIQPDMLAQFHTISDLIHWLCDSIYVYEAALNGQPLYDPVIETIKGYIQKNLSTNLKASDLARVVNFSESYFTIYFKNKTGENFRDYVLNARIAYAKQLLSQNRQNISEIAALTGYQDYRSFSRAFKKVTGVSPSEYHPL